MTNNGKINTVTGTIQSCRPRSVAVRHEHLFTDYRAPMSLGIQSEIYPMSVSQCCSYLEEISVLGIPRSGRCSSIGVGRNP